MPMSALASGATKSCTDVWAVSDQLAILNMHAIEGGAAAPSKPDWQAADTMTHDLAIEAPQTTVGSFTVRADANTLAHDVDDILANGFSTGNGGANLQADDGTVQVDAQRLGCPDPDRPRTGTVA